MASNEDTDDLYADLYGPDGSGDGDQSFLGGEGGEDNAQPSDEQDLIGYEQDDHNSKQGSSNDKPEEKPAPAPSSGSFIPPPSTSAPAQSAETGLQIKGSFIPPPAASSTPHSHSDVRDLTPASHNDASANQQSASHPSQGAGGGDDGQNGGTEGERSDNRSIVPHEMPEEGKMFIGGLNWDTTEDSLRRYFSQFGEVGHCTIMRDNMTGRSRGFAFLNFVDPKAVNTVVVREHYLDGKVIDPKRAIPRPQRDSNYNHHQNGGGSAHSNYGGMGGASGGGCSAQNQKLFVGGLPPSATPASFRTFFEQFGTLVECTCMMDRETGNPRGFGFLTYQDDAALQHVLNTRPLVFDGKEVDVKRAQSKNDPQSLQIRRQQRIDNPEMAMGMGGMGMQQSGGRYGMNNNYNAGGAGNFGGNTNAWAMNPMMMGMGTADPNAMAQMYQSMGWGNANWNPQMAWQQMMASMAGQAGNAAGAGAGMDMGAMMSSMGMGGMGMMGAGMGSMSPPMNSAMSPNAQPAAAVAPPTGPKALSNNGEDRNDRSGPATAGRFQRGGGFNNNGGPRPPTGPRYDRERSPNRGGDDRNGGGGGGYRRERSPNRRDDGRRYDNGNRNRY